MVRAFDRNDVAGAEIVRIGLDHKLAVARAGRGRNEFDVVQTGSGAVERKPRASDRMRLDRDHCSACGDMARQRQGVSADIGPYIDEDAALRRVRAQKIQLYNVVLRIEQRAALGRARLMVKSK